MTTTGACGPNRDVVGGSACYPAYKDSGIEWLGEIPEHWEVRRLKSLCSRYAQYGANVPASRYWTSGVRFVRTTDIGNHGELTGTGVFLPEDLVSDYVLADGDLLISRSGTIGRSFLYERRTHGPCAYAGYLVRFVPTPALLSRYAFYYTKSRPFVDFVGMMAISSTIDNVNGEKYAHCPLPLPLTSEQAEIIGFLDQETAGIDTLIAKQRELIHQLNEKRTALISHAVTKGLDPDVPMKDTGVEWLGEIPAHWEVRRLKECATVSLSNVDKKSVEGEASVWLCNYMDVYHQERIDAQVDFMAATATQSQIRRFSLRKGDVLITKDSETWTDIAVPALVSEDLLNVLCGYHLALVRPRSSCVGAFLAHAIRAIGPRDQYQVSANGITRFGLTANAIRGSVLPIPPTSEQQAIADHLDRETAKIDALTTKITESIGLLTEYRTALISAAVTGKIDVRSHRADAVLAQAGTEATTP